MDFEYQPSDGRLKTPINGRYLGFTTSPSLEFLEINQRFCHPFWTPQFDEVVLYGSSQKPGYGFSFIIEGQGFLLTEGAQNLSLVQTDEYQRFNYDPMQHNNDYVRAYAPPARVVKAVEIPFAAGTNDIPANYVGRFWRVKLPAGYENTAQGLEYMWLSYDGSFNPGDPTGSLVEAELMVKYTSHPYPSSHTPTITL